MKNEFEKYISEKVEFNPDYQKIKGNIQISKYLKKNKFKEEKSIIKIFKYFSPVLIIIFIIPLIIILSKNIGPSNPDVISGIEKIENKSYANFIRFDIFSIFQNQNDVIVLDVEIVPWTEKKLKKLYINGNSLDIKNAQAFSNDLNKTIINNKEYFYLDLEQTNKANYKDFLLFLEFDINSCTRNSQYSDIVDTNIVAHSFDILVDYSFENKVPENSSDNEFIENSNQIAINSEFNLRFYYEESNIYNSEIICYNNVTTLLNEVVFDNLYLPDLNIYPLSEQILYSLNQNIISINSLNYYRYSTDIRNVSFTLGVRVSDTNISYGDQIKIPYTFNGINYMIIVHEASVTYQYGVDFAVYDENLKKTVQYNYIVNASSIELVKEFINTITK